MEEKCRKSMENHVSFVKRNIRPDSTTTTTSKLISSRDNNDGGAYTPEDSETESGDDERTIVEAEKADGLFRGDESDWRGKVDEELEDLKADAEKPLDEILTVLPREYVESMMLSSSSSSTTNRGVGLKEDSDDDIGDDDDDISSFASARGGVRGGGITESDDDEDDEEDDHDETMEGDKIGDYPSMDAQTISDIENGGVDETEEEDNVDPIVQLWRNVGDKDLSGQDKWITEVQQYTAHLHPKLNDKSDEDIGTGVGSVGDDESSSLMTSSPSAITLSSTKNLLLFHGTLRDYQRRGVVWLSNVAAQRHGAVLADDKGLGKTVQVAALCAYLATADDGQNVGGDWGPHLVIAPSYAMAEWERIFKKFFPGCKVFSYYGGGRERRCLRAEWLAGRVGGDHCQRDNDRGHYGASAAAIGAGGIFLTSYRTALRDVGWITRRRWRGVFLDEMQHVKDFATERWLPLRRKLRCAFRIIITNASPSKSSANELWAWLEFLFPRLFDDDEKSGGVGGNFKKWLSLSSTSKESSATDSSSSTSSSSGDKIFQRLQKLTRAFTLRRSKSDLERQLPQREDHVMLCRMSSRQRLLYDDLMEDESTTEAVKSGKFVDVMRIVMNVKRLASHPELAIGCGERQPETAVTMIPSIEMTVPRMVAGLTLAHFSLNAEDSLPKLFNCVSTIGEGIYESRRCLELMTTLEMMKTVFATTNNPTTTISADAIKREIDEDAMDVTPTSDGTQVIKTDISHVPEADDLLHRLFTVNNGRCHSPSVLDQDTLRICQLLPREQNLGARGFHFRGRGASNSCFRVASSGSQLSDCINADLSEVITRKWLEDSALFLRDLSEVFVPPVLAAYPILRAASTSYTSSSPLSTLPILRPSKILSPPCPRSPLHTRLSPLLPSLRLHWRLPSLRRLVFDSGKLVSLDDIVTELLHCSECGGETASAGNRSHPPHRLVVFAQMTETLDLLERYFVVRRLPHVRLDANDSIETRQRLATKFNEDPRYFCCLSGTRAGWTGSGGCLPRGVDNIVLFESDWNPTFEAQVAEKCRRFGLQGAATLRVYRLLAEDTIEENVYKKGSSVKWLYQDVAVAPAADDVSAAVTAGKSPSPMSSSAMENETGSRCVFKPKTLIEMFPGFEIDYSAATALTASTASSTMDKKQKQKSKVSPASASSAAASSSSPSSKSVSSSGHVPPVLLDCLKSLEAAEDVRAGEVTNAEMTSRLSEFADEDFSLEANLLGTLKDNETRPETRKMVNIGGVGDVAEEEFSIKREV